MLLFKSWKKQVVTVAVIGGAISPLIKDMTLDDFPMGLEVPRALPAMAAIGLAAIAGLIRVIDLVLRIRQNVELMQKDEFCWRGVRYRRSSEDSNVTHTNSPQDASV